MDEEENMREKVMMMMMLTMMTIIPHLMADGKEDEVDDEEDDLVAEQDVGHKGDQGKPGGGNICQTSLSCSWSALIGGHGDDDIIHEHI